VSQNVKASLVKYESIRFKWGVHDCCLFSANVIKDTIGIDYAKDFRNKYSSEEEAWNIVNYDLKSFITKLFNTPLEYNFEECKTGFPVGMKQPQGYSIGIAYGCRAYFVTELNRYLKVPLRKCEGFWRIF
jgi:hypothetical protein